MCSAGVGRTGSYIVIESMLKRLRNEETIDIYGYTTHIRRQRNHMVWTEEQYYLIHDVILEAVKNECVERESGKLTGHQLESKVGEVICFYPNHSSRSEIRLNPILLTVQTCILIPGQRETSTLKQTGGIVSF